MNPYKLFLIIICLLLNININLAENAMFLAGYNGNFVVGKKFQDDQKRIKEVEAAIKSNSESFGLDNLKTKILTNFEFEIRIWTDQEVLLHCFILGQKNNIWKTSLITKIVESGKLVDFANGQSSLAEPKGSWKVLNNFLVKRKINAPLQYSLEKEKPNLLPDPDNGWIVLEIRKGQKYDLIFYRLSSKSKDGVNLIKICKHLQNEFDINIGCG